MNHFPKTDQPSHCQLAAVDDGLEDSKGLETGGNKPLMRNLRADLCAATRDGITAANTFTEENAQGRWSALTFNMINSILWRIRSGVRFYHRTSNEVWLCLEFLAWFKGSDGKWRFNFNPPF